MCLQKSVNNERAKPNETKTSDGTKQLHCLYQINCTCSEGLQLSDEGRLHGGGVSVE